MHVGFFQLHVKVTSRFFCVEFARYINMLLFFQKYLRPAYFVDDRIE